MLEHITVMQPCCGPNADIERYKESAGLISVSMCIFELAFSLSITRCPVLSTGYTIQGQKSTQTPLDTHPTNKMCALRGYVVYAKYVRRFFAEVYDPKGYNAQ